MCTGMPSACEEFSGMIEIQVMTRAGNERRIAVRPGMSLMEALRDGGRIAGAVRWVLFLRDLPHLCGARAGWVGPAQLLRRGGSR